MSSVSRARACARTRAAANDSWLRTAAATIAFGLIISGCGGSPPTEPWPLSEVRLPSLSCRDSIPQLGECARNADCGKHEFCSLDPALVPADRDPLALRCGAAAGAGRARERCEQGADCASGLCGLSQVCLSPCGGDSDCQRGETCQPLEVRILQGLAPVQACARVAAFPPDVQLEIKRLAPVRAADSNVVLSAQGADALFYLLADCGRTLTIEHVSERATSHVLFDLASQLDGRVQPNPVNGAGSLVPLQIPNNPRLRLVADYDVVLSADRDSSLTLVSAFRARRGKMLDVNIFYVGGGGSLQADGLRPGSREFAAVLQRLSARYAAIGIVVGEVREYDVTGALRDQLGALEVRTLLDDQGRFLRQEVANLDRLFALSAGTADGGLNVFLVRSLGPLLGISGGTPGAIGLQGTPLSGTAIALDRVELEALDRVVFHELGHQMGLFHTSESDGSSQEPLSDTPVCGPDNDHNGDGVLRAAECEGRGADNLMFWEGGGDALSAQQVEILQRSLILR